MKKLKRGCRGSVFTVALSLVMAFLLVGCQNTGKSDDIIPPVHKAVELGADDFLHAEGELVKNAKGETVYLRGVNVGGLFVIEQWMNGFTRSNATEEIPVTARDHRSTTQVFLERFGEEKTKQLWNAYQENWWSEIDFENCAEMGMNVIRLPFTYMNVDFAAVESYDNAGKNYDFSALDSFVETAASYGIYTILDLHGAYGTQNGQDHSGETRNAAEVDFYTNSYMQMLTVQLWRALAEHYKDNPAVAGYDLLNEPGEKGGTTEKRHFDVFDLLYDAIREVDKNHIVIFESCWDGENLPQPSLYGWENCMYSFHHYTNYAQGGQYLQHGTSWNDKLAEISRQNFGVPLYMGEFTCYNDGEQWEYCLDLLNRSNWHWTSWTYKINNTSNNSAWGIYSIQTTNEKKVNAHNDSYEEIMAKFATLRTTEDVHMTNLDGRTLKDILTEYYTAPVQKTLEAGGYIFYDSLSDFPLVVSGGKIVRSDDRNASMQIIVSPHPDGDASVYLYTEGKYLYTSGNGSVELGSLQNSVARFYPVETEYGYAFYSYTTCRYLRFDDNGYLLADGTDLYDSAIFYCV